MYDAAYNTLIMQEEKENDDEKSCSTSSHCEGCIRVCNEPQNQETQYFVGTIN